MSIAFIAAISASPAMSENAVRARTDAPATTAGYYIARGACPFEGCTYDFEWRATKTVPVFNQPVSGRNVGRILQGETVVAENGFVRLKPRRGIVLKSDDLMKAGDVVYLLDNEGEGFVNTWRRGESLSWYVPDDPEAVRWDGPQPPSPEWWVKVRRRSGQTVWVLNPAGFECMDQLGGDEHCKPARRTRHTP